MTDTDRCVCGHWWAEHKPAGCYARTGIDEWCNCPAAGDPSQPTTRKPFPGGVENTVGGWVLYRPDPVGDDTPEFCDCEDADSPFRHRVGDGTPAPTAGQWSLAEDEATYIDIESAIHQHMGHDGQSDEANDWVTDLMAAIAPFMERAVNRAEAAPDHTAHVPDTDWLLDALRRRMATEPGLLAAVAALVRALAATTDPIRDDPANYECGPGRPCPERAHDHWPGDDTPAPTGQWIVDGNLVRRVDNNMHLLVGPEHVPESFTERNAIAQQVADALNRAEAAPDHTALQLAYAIERFLAPQRCTTPEGVGGSQPGVHCAACCMGTGWATPSSHEELEAARALDVALHRLRAALVRDTPDGDDGD